MTLSCWDRRVAVLTQHAALWFPRPQKGSRSPQPFPVCPLCLPAWQGWFEPLCIPPGRGGGGDTIKRKQAEGLAVFSCFNSELSAVGTTLSEQDKGDKMKTLPTSPLPVSPEFSIKGMAERESML